MKSNSSNKDIHQNRNYLFIPYVLAYLKYVQARKPPSKIIKVHGYHSHLLTINLVFQIAFYRFIVLGLSLSPPLLSLTHIYVFFLSLARTCMYNVSPPLFYSLIAISRKFCRKMSRYFNFFLEAVGGEPQ